MNAEQLGLDMEKRVNLKPDVNAQLNVCEALDKVFPQGAPKIEPNVKEWAEEADNRGDFPAASIVRMFEELD